MQPEIISVIALSMGAAWASGINLYAAVFMLGFMGANGYADLPPELALLEDPIVLAAAAMMYFVEFFMDKVPGIDTGWDTLHTFIRIPAGAVIAAGAMGDVNPAIYLAAGLLGGGTAAASHAAKSGTRVMINASPEPFTNWGASLTEDVAVFAGVWAALIHPWVFVVLFIAWIALLIWLLPKLWRGIKKAFRWLIKLFSGNAPETSDDKKPTSQPISLPPKQDN